MKPPPGGFFVSSCIVHDALQLVIFVMNGCPANVRFMTVARGQLLAHPIRSPAARMLTHFAVDYGLSNERFHRVGDGFADRAVQRLDGQWRLPWPQSELIGDKIHHPQAAMSPKQLP